MSILVRAILSVALLVTLVLVLRSTTANVSVGIIGLVHDDNPNFWASRQVVAQTSEMCVDCHEATNVSWEAAAHIRVSCDTCHGASADHIVRARANLDAQMPLPDPRGLCTTCHAEMPSRPDDFPQVDPLTHGAPAEGLISSCVSCHNAHDPGFPADITHTLEGRADCLECHSADEWKPLPPSHIDRPVDTCLTCHNPEDN